MCTEYISMPSILQQKGNQQKINQKGRNKESVYLFTHQAKKFHDFSWGKSSRRRLTTMVTGRCAKELALLKKNRRN